MLCYLQLRTQSESIILYIYKFELYDTPHINSKYGTQGHNSMFPLFEVFGMFPSHFPCQADWLELVHDAMSPCLFWKTMFPHLLWIPALGLIWRISPAYVTYLSPFSASYLDMTGLAGPILQIHAWQSFEPLQTPVLRQVWFFWSC